MSQESRLTNNTLIPLGVAITCLIAAISGTWYVAQQVTNLRTEIRAALSDRWTASDMERWAYRLEKDNREAQLRVPDVRLTRSENHN